MTYDTPVKCPDCSTWWRGTEHRCGPRSIVQPWVRPEHTIWVYSTTCGGGMGSGSLSVTMPPGSMLINNGGDDEPPEPQRAGALA